MHHPHAHLLRRGRFSEPGRLYLLTTVTHKRKPIFRDFHLARRVIEQMRQTEREQACLSLAWVLMPDHLHWLIELKEVTLTTLMRRFKSRSSHVLYKDCNYRSTVWQRGYHDHGLRCEENILQVARYIAANPLRARLVEHLGDYPHWDAIWL